MEQELRERLVALVARIRREDNCTGDPAFDNGQNVGRETAADEIEEILEETK